MQAARCWRRRESRSRPQMGIVTVHTVGYNQDNETVIEFKRTIMVYKRGYLPASPFESRR